jgi:hypothetical protein
MSKVGSAGGEAVDEPAGQCLESRSELRDRLVAERRHQQASQSGVVLALQAEQHVTPPV